MLTVDWSEFEKLQKELKVAAEKAIPHAARNAVNRCAFETRTAWIGKVRQTFTVRSTFTERSLRVEKARGAKLEQLQAVVGSTADYMKRREEGETKRPAQGKNLPIPTVAGARGGALQSLVKRPNQMRAITLLSRPGGTKKQRNAVAIRQAKEKGTKFAYLEGTRGGGIVRVMGGKRRTKLRAVWDLSRPSVNVKPMPTLEPTLKQLASRYERIHVDSLVEQFRRNKVLGY